MRLQSDLGINLAGAALVLQLLDEIENLRAEVKAMGAE
jgi:chaperone modulatory protein CbpM